MDKSGDVYVVSTEGHWVTSGDPKNYFLAHLQYVLKNENYAEDIRNVLENA